VAYGYHVIVPGDEYEQAKQMAISRYYKIEVDGLFVVLPQPQVNHAIGKNWTVIGEWPVTFLTKKQMMLWSALAAGVYVLNGQNRLLG